MDPKLLTESGLKAILSKHKLKDNGLQRALATYDKLEDDAHDDCLETIAQIGKLAAALKKVKDVAANKAVAEYLEDVMDAADSEEKEVIKAKAVAEKEAANQKKAQEEEDEDEGEEEEEEEGEYADRLLGAFKKLKSMGGKPMKFVVCEARPFCGLMVARRISPKHKEELTELTGGSKKFLKVGECHFENGTYVFTSEQSVPGLARRLQKAVKNHTGKKFKFANGGETVEEDDEQEEAAPEDAGAPAAAESAAPQPESTESAGTSAPEATALANAPEVWRQTRQTISAGVDQLKAAILAEFANERQDVVAQIQQGVTKFDRILSTLDQKLADSMAKAHAANDPAARAAELKNSKSILADYIKFVKSEPLIGHIDSNPFGVQTNLMKTLSESLKNMARAIS